MILNTILIYASHSYRRKFVSHSINFYKKNFNLPLKWSEFIKFYISIKEEYLMTKIFSLMKIITTSY